MERSVNLGLRFGSVGLGCFVSLCICLFGAIFAAVSVPDLRDYRSSSSWETANGEVINSEVQFSNSTDSDGNSSTTYRAYVQYRYFVNDREYTGDRLKFGGDIYTSNRNSQQATVDKYAAGTKIEVYYDPLDPSNSVVERDLSDSLVVFAVIGGICVVVAIVVFIVLVFVMPFVISRFQKKDDNASGDFQPYTP